jgi:hypothetical protein
MVWESNPIGARFSAPFQTAHGINPATYTVGTGTFSVVKRLGRRVDHPPHLAPRMKQEEIYTFALPGLSWLVEGKTTYNRFVPVSFRHL